jgi:hypothetical protein
VSHNKLHTGNLHPEVARLGLAVLVAAAMKAVLDLLVAGFRALCATDGAEPCFALKGGRLDRSLSTSNPHSSSGEQSH